MDRLASRYASGPIEEERIREAALGALLARIGVRNAPPYLSVHIGINEELASFGVQDERDIEQHLLAAYRGRLTQEQLPEAKQTIEELAMRLLSELACWRAVEALAQRLLHGVQQAPEESRLAEEEVHAIVSQAFAAQV